VKKIAYLGTKQIGQVCLGHLLSVQAELGCEVVCVLSNQRQLHGKDAPSVRQTAEAHGIPILPSLEAYLVEPDVDIAISVQYHQILRPVHIAKAKERTVNLHMAPLPEYRGCNQFSFAIVNGDTEFGTTLHEMDAGIDSGPILAERRFPIPEGCYVGDLYQLAFEESFSLFKDSLPSLVSGELEPIPQSSRPGVRSELHYRDEIEGLKQIDPDWDAEKISRYFRATAMPGFPPPYMIIGGRKVTMNLIDG
jgi:methionyl-tRNA formyltransferase